jgi:RES domain
MPKFPEPPAPAVLSTIAPDILVLPKGTSLCRIFFRGGSHPVEWNEFRFWGPADSRFDHHERDTAGNPTSGTRGIYYAAGKGALSGLGICLAEVFQLSRVIDADLNNPWFTVFSTERDLELLDLRGPFATRMGASAAINSGAKRRAQRWSKALHEAFPAADGIIYPSSMGGGSDAFALYEKAASALPASPRFHRPLNDPSLSSEILGAAGKIGYLIALA